MPLALLGTVGSAEASFQDLIEASDMPIVVPFDRVNQEVVPAGLEQPDKLGKYLGRTRIHLKLETSKEIQPIFKPLCSFRCPRHFIQEHDVFKEVPGEPGQCRRRCFVASLGRR